MNVGDKIFFWAIFGGFLPIGLVTYVAMAIGYAPSMLGFFAASAFLLIACMAIAVSAFIDWRKSMER